MRFCCFLQQQQMKVNFQTIQQNLFFRRSDLIAQITLEIESPITSDKAEHAPVGHSKGFTNPRNFDL